MSYSDFYGTKQVPKKGNLFSSVKKIKEINLTSDFESKLGIPSKPLRHQKESVNIKKTLDHFNNQGFGTIPKDLTVDFLRHLIAFRVRLILWDELIEEKCIDKEEVYFRCLSEGPSFTKYLKDARAASLMYKTSITNSEISEDLIFEDYSGYDSLPSERWMIHWDDSDETDDFTYAFIESRPVDEELFREYISDMFSGNRVNQIEFDLTLDMLQELKNSSSYDPVNEKSSLMRELWSKALEVSKGPYFARRRVIPVGPGNTRDTGVADPETLLKVKLLNKLCQQVLEVLPYSANCDGKLAEARIRRVLRRNHFVHLDFKKYGLTFPRKLQNIAIEEICKLAGLDPALLRIDTVLVQDGDTVYETERGIMLGWLDPLNEICVHAILENLSSKKGLKFDHVGFNDDFEIGKSIREDEGSLVLQMLRMTLICELDRWDILISSSKTYGSKMSQFLERYNYSSKYNLDMRKRQLCIKGYSNAIVTKFAWEAKIQHATASLWCYNSDISDLCISSREYEFFRREASVPLMGGGWFFRLEEERDMALRDCSSLTYAMASAFQGWKPPEYSLKTYKAPSLERISRAIYQKELEALGPDLPRLTMSMPGKASEINEADLDTISRLYDTVIRLYSGRDEVLASNVSWVVGNYIRRVHDPGG